MTLIVSWIACDNKPDGQKVPSALYFGADSRITWNKGKDGICDTSQKLYCCQKLPEMFAICGDVSFIQHFIPNLISRIDSGLFFDNGIITSTHKAELVKQYFEKQKLAFRKFRQEEMCIIYYGSKIGNTFSMFRYEITFDSVIMAEVPIKNESDVLITDGSGKKDFNDNMVSVAHTNEANTSRGIYHCISKTIDTSKEITVGGVPQLVALYRGLPEPRVFGIIKEGRRYLYGSEINDRSNLNSVEWRDDCFQRIDPETLKLIEGAQAQPFVE